MYTLLFLIACSIAERVILVPRANVAEVVNVESIVAEHKMSTLATFDQLSIYSMEHSDFTTYEATLRNIFYIEQEQVYTIRHGDSERSENNENSESNFILVDTVETDGKVESIETVQPDTWHLQRIVKRTLVSNESTDFPYERSGSCHTNSDAMIDTYVIDTGIDVEHPEFQGRAKWAANFIDDKDKDCNSHGTHCAGLVGSKTFGVCKDANLFAVKVLNCEGSGSTSSVIKGIEYAYAQHLERYRETDGKTRSVVSMSLGGGYSRALNMAVKATLKHSAFYFAAAAGNESNDACKTSPASVKEIFTVMASDKRDNRAYFSNYGKCADVYSPGVDIYSTIPNGQFAKYSGTSMATPILVGVLNHYINQNPDLNMNSMKKLLLKDSTKDIMTGNPKGTNNLFVYLNRD